MKMTISQVASRAGVGVETVRFYERAGLLNQPPRPDSGYRHYPPDTVRRIQFIKQAKALGFSLKEIAELFSLRVAPGSTCADVKQRTLAKIEDIQRKIDVLMRMKRVLMEVGDRCSGEGPLSDCPILDALSDPSHGAQLMSRKEQGSYATFAPH